MNCVYCGSIRITRKGIRKEKAVQRYKCNDCGRWFCERSGSFYFRHRFPPFVMFFAIMLCIVLRASLVSFFVNLLFGCYVSPKTIRLWTRKFLKELPDAFPPVKVCEKVFLICHADEKFVKIRGKQGYIWNVVDADGNWITSMVTMKRDKESAKKLYKQLKQVYPKVDIIVTDGLQSYKQLNTLFGRRCKHVVTGLKPKPFNHKKHLLYLSNNPVESLHSHLEMYLARFRYHFTNLESANAWIKGCMFITCLLRNFRLQRSLRHPSMPGIWEKKIAEVAQCRSTKVVA